MTEKIKLLMQNLIKRDYFWIAAAAFLFFTFLTVQSNYLMDQDAYYHIKIAEMYRDHGFISKLPWMTYSVQAERFVDFHFLFHWLLVPFTLMFSNLIWAMKAAIIFYLTAAVFILGFVLNKFDVKYRWIYPAFFILSSPIVLGRMLFGRGIIIFVSLIFLFIYFLHFNKLIPLAVVSFVSVWTYPGFPVLIVFFLFHQSIKFIRDKKADYKFILLTMAGFLAGIIIHPAFPAQFYGYYLELVRQFIQPAGIESIAEWTSADKGILITALGLPLTAMIFRLIIIREHTALESSLLILVMLVLFSLTFSIKPLEYLLPFLTFYLALNSWDSYSHVLRKIFAAFLISGMVLWSAPQIYQRLVLHNKMNDPVFDFDAADWLANNTEKDTVVMLSWGDFPEFFFRNTHNRYLFGLNPVYSYFYKKNAYIMIKNFFNPVSMNLNIAGITRALNCGYAVINKDDNKMLYNIFLQTRLNADKRYENDRFIIYKMQNLQ